VPNLRPSSIQAGAVPSNPARPACRAPGLDATGNGVTTRRKAGTTGPRGRIASLARVNAIPRIGAPHGHTQPHPSIHRRDTLDTQTLPATASPAPDPDTPRTVQPA
jgi:hypothetical protein